MDATGYFVTGLARPLVLLLFWVPLIAAVLWLVRRYAPRQERWLFYRITGPAIAQAIRRLLRPRARVTFQSRASRSKDRW